MLPLRAAFVKETTLFREYGPLAGSTMSFGYETSPAISQSWLSRQTLDGDIRHYTRLAANGVFAVRLKGMKSWGNNPDYFRFGGNSEMRGYDYLAFNGQKGFFANAELRFPLVDAMLTPFGVVGGLRGVFFFNVGGAGFNALPGIPEFKFLTRDPVTITPIVDFQQIDQFGSIAPVYGAPITIDGFRLVDGRASYGFGLESFLLGFPMHFDWSWKTLFNKDWENALFAYQGFLYGESGSQWFRRVKFSFWIGYDF
jgi:outer membrane protein assembly factor BamA